MHLPIPLFILNLWHWLTTTPTPPAGPHTTEFRYYTRRVWWFLDDEAGCGQIGFEAISRDW
jgi:hypothetical protein